MNAGVGVRSMALTGYPGWFSEALMRHLASLTVPPTRMVVLCQPDRLEQSTFPTVAWAQDTVPFDLANPTKVAQRLEGVDVLIHAAGVIHVSRTQDWYAINHIGTVALAREAKKAGVRRFVFLSSIAAAGVSRPGRPMRESDEARPLHHYGRSKLLAEKDLLAMHEPGAFEVVILRPATFYGPPVPPRHITFYHRILGGPIPLIGTGGYERCMIYVDNLVEAALLAASHPRAGGNVYFIVDDEIYTTRSIFEAMARALNTEARFLPLPSSFGTACYHLDGLLSRANIYVQPIHLLGESNWNQAATCEKAARELGYAPKVRLNEGMRIAIDWCREKGLVAL